MKPQAKIDNFAFKNSNIILEGLIWKRKDYFTGNNLKYKKIILLINFIIALTFFLTVSYQILKNDAILLNHGSFFQEKYSLQLNRLQFSKMNKLLPNSAICL